MPLESESLSVRLAEIERHARISTNVSASVVLELVSTLRQYMAHAEYTNRIMESIEAKLKECKL